MYWPRGRVWGGSSAINAMVYIRGHACDYDRWVKEGADGWSYAECLPYFRKSQCHALGADDYRGGNGPLHVSRGAMDNPLFQAFIEAGQQSGYPYTSDVNGFQQEGVGPFDLTVYKEVRSRARTTKILFEGSKAVGVEYIQDRQLKRARARKEIILSGGAINSPQLLMLSGVGDAVELKKHGITVVADSPGVGRNLQDHLEVYVQQTRFWYMPVVGIQWFLTRTGACGTSSLEAGGFVRTRDEVSHPDVQFHFLPFAVEDHGRKFPDGHAYQLHAGTMRCTSRGWIRLKSSDPYDHPIMDPCYLATEDDVKDMRACVKLARDIFAQKAFDPFRGPERQPGVSVETDEEIDAFVRERGDSAYHPSCTCKMGRHDDRMAVVDSQGRVKGVDNLRVVDASIMPSVVSGNLNAPVMMMAEKLADAIRGLVSMPRSNAPVYLTPSKAKSHL